MRLVMDEMADLRSRVTTLEMATFAGEPVYGSLLSDLNQGQGHAAGNALASAAGLTITLPPDQVSVAGNALSELVQRSMRRPGLGMVSPTKGSGNRSGS